MKKCFDPVFHATLHASSRQVTDKVVDKLVNKEERLAAKEPDICPGDGGN